VIRPEAPGEACCDVVSRSIPAVSGHFLDARAGATPALGEDNREERVVPRKPTYLRSFRTLAPTYASAEDGDLFRCEQPHPGNGVSADTQVGSPKATRRDFVRAFSVAELPRSIG
jgi:hypothetical protein